MAVFPCSRIAGFKSAKNFCTYYRHDMPCYAVIYFPVNFTYSRDGRALNISRTDTLIFVELLQQIEFRADGRSV